MNAPTPRTRFWRPLPWLEIRQSHEMRNRFVPHTHPGLSIGLIDQGATVLDLGGRRVPLATGQAVLIPPGLAHACNPDPSQPWSNRMLFLDAEALEGLGLAGLMPGHALVVTNPAACRQLSALIDDLRTTDGPRHCTEALLQGLAELLEPQPPEKRRSAPDWLAPLQRYLTEHCTENLPLETLAERSGLGPYQLIRGFKAETGLTPHAWLLDQRVQRARELLREPGRSLSEIALTTGFADQSHFSRAFKARTAVTPGRYRGKP